MTESGDRSTDEDVLEPVGSDASPAVSGAVRDALFDTVGTLLLLALALLCLAVGVQLLLTGSAGAAFVLAGGVLGIGCVLVAAAFDLVPSFHERFVD
ncbi:hypothetical protein [Natronococcus occultus]|uniref:Uncharacterized protein n=1 Tax=Natronococcus occultus SP4 TaxID=694430 RepID=L0JZ95_9EURY|nr:hypothetical protein [Natronococcus occultus]AGB37630.1 hypothetical protein Natoc_1835 [Natronococcus occultus SP4]